MAGTQAPPKPPAQPPKRRALSPEDEFDASVLALSGPWLSSKDAESQPTPAEHPPQVFNGVESYRSAFRPLLIEECRAMLISKWEEECSQPGKTHGIRSCNLRVYQTSAYDPLSYVETTDAPGLEQGQIVLIQKSGVTRCISIVNARTTMSSSGNSTRISIIFRVLDRCGITNGQFDLRPLDNLTTLKRTYLSMYALSSFSTPIRRQILNPACNLDSLLWLSNCQQCDTALSEWTSWLEKFNRQQLLGVIAALRLEQGFFLIQGPPGTGKTTTIIGIISAVLAERPSAKILLSAPSNAALDEAGCRLMKEMIGKDGTCYAPPEGTVVRIGPKGSISNACYPITVEGILCRRHSDWRQKEWKAEELALLKGASVICTTLSGCGHWLMEELKLEFDLVIVDEAVQAVETEALISLQRATRRCVLIGDPCQLPATVFQRPADSYRRSLFERMQEAGAIPHFLDTQYRMLEEISHFPSRHFYGGALKDSAEVASRESIFKQQLLGQVIFSDGYYFRLCQYSFLDLKSGLDEVDVKGRSRYNDNEAKAVISVVRGILSNVKASGKLEMGIVTPYSSQKNRILTLLTADEKRICEINTIDGFQGREKDIILVSCVRAQEGKGLGFVSDRRRLNVALTRAKHGLFIVGHAQALQQASSDWKALIENARARGVYQVLSTLHPDKHKVCYEADPSSRRTTLKASRPEISPPRPGYSCEGPEPPSSGHVGPEITSGMSDRHRGCEDRGGQEKSFGRSNHGRSSGSSWTTTDEYLDGTAEHRRDPSSSRISERRLGNTDTRNFSKTPFGRGKSPEAKNVPGQSSKKIRRRTNVVTEIEDKAIHKEVPARDQHEKEEQPTEKKQKADAEEALGTQKKRRKSNTANKSEDRSDVEKKQKRPHADENAISADALRLEEVGKQRKRRKQQAEITPDEQILGTHEELPPEQMQVELKERKKSKKRKRSSYAGEGDLEPKEVRTNVEVAPEEKQRKKKSRKRGKEDPELENAEDEQGDPSSSQKRNGTEPKCAHPSRSKGLQQRESDDEGRGKQKQTANESLEEKAEPSKKRRAEAETEELNNKLEDSQPQTDPEQMQKRGKAQAVSESEGVSAVSSKSTRRRKALRQKKKQWKEARISE